MPLEYPNRKLIASNFVSNIGSGYLPPFGNNARMRNRIKEWRTKRDLSQDQVAEAMGIKKAAVSKLERGKMNLTQEYMARFAKVFNCQPYEIIAETGHSGEVLSQAEMILIQLLHSILLILMRKNYILDSEMEDALKHASALSTALRLKNAAKIVELLHNSLEGEAPQAERELIHRLLQLVPAGSA